MGNFRIPPQAPPLFSATKESLLKDTQDAIASRRAVLDGIARSVTPETATFENVLAVMGINEGVTCLKQGIIEFLQYVSGDPEIRDASSKAEELFDEFAVDVKTRPDIFDLVDAVYQKREALSLDAESARYLKKVWKQYISHGLGLPAGPQRELFKYIRTRLNIISTEFIKNISEECGGLWFTADELEGMPGDDISELDKGTGENDGKLWLAFQDDAFTAMRHVLDPEVRRKIVVGNENKCNQNSALLKESIVLRDEAARLMGYENHASLILEDHMAKTVDNVKNFVEDLRDRLAPGGKRDIERLLQLKRSDHEARSLESSDNFYLWDYRFYSRMLLERDYSITSSEIADYFPLGHTISVMLKIFEELMGFVFVELDADKRARLSPTGKAEDIVWHEDVTVFSVWNDESEGGEFVGYLYLDLLSRSGKYTQDMNMSILKGFLHEDGTRHFSSTVLICNFSQPTADEPTLLAHGGVVDMFHELGHAIHDLATRCRFSTFHGSSVRDFIEAPSQMLENWCWTPGVLKRLSRHWKTGEPIPDSQIENIIRTKHVNSSLTALRTLQPSIFDLICHSPATHEDVKAMNISSTYNRCGLQTVGLKGPEAQGQPSDWGRGECNFDHLIAGYDAGYYSYLYSAVFSTDMFHTVFNRDPMDGKEGRRYRHTILEYGGSRDEMESLKEFLGREPSTEPFYRELGLS